MTNPAHLSKLIHPLFFRMEATNQLDISCSVNILRRAGYQIETLDEDDSCTQYLGDSTNANSLRALVPVETRPSVYMNWAMDPLSLKVEEDCRACGNYSLSFQTKLL